MPLTQDSQACTLLLFVQPGGEIESLAVVSGALDCTGAVMMFVPFEGGEKGWAGGAVEGVGR